MTQSDMKPMCSELLSLEITQYLKEQIASHRKFLIVELTMASALNIVIVACPCNTDCLYLHYEINCRLGPK